MQARLSQSSLIVGDVEHVGAVKVHLELTTDEACQIYFALLHMKNSLIKDISNTERNRGHEAEEAMFLGEQIHKTGSLLFDYENLIVDDGDNLAQFLEVL